MTRRDDGNTTLRVTLPHVTTAVMRGAEVGPGSRAPPSLKTTQTQWRGKHSLCCKYYKESSEMLGGDD